MVERILTFDVQILFVAYDNCESMQIPSSRFLFMVSKGQYHREDVFGTPNTLYIDSWNLIRKVYNQHHAGYYHIFDAKIPSHPHHIKFMLAYLRVHPLNQSDQRLCSLPCNAPVVVLAPFGKPSIWAGTAT